MLRTGSALLGILGALTVSPAEAAKPGCTGAALMADDAWRAAEHRFPRALPRRYTVWAHGTGTAADPAHFRYRCRVRSRIVQSKREDHPVRVTSMTCANQRAARWRYSFTMA
jgi:hypothetical protein